jgi:nicotinate phosphoribosyltransferase
MAHSWVMSFDSEEEAFENYAALYPDRTTFLIDTYDTLKSGILNAIKVGKKLAIQGKNFGVRLDSGDIQYLSTEVRKKLNEAGLNKAFITVSNDLDEHIIEMLVKEGAPVDSWGVGTRMVTGGHMSAFPGVYKMAARLNGDNVTPVMKVSDNPEKTTNPGIKQVWRIKDKNGSAIADVLALAGNDSKTDIEGFDSLKSGERYCFWHPSGDYRHFNHTIVGSVQTLLKKRLECGVFTEPLPSLDEIKVHSHSDLESFDATYKRLLNPHIYKVSITGQLRDLKLELIRKHLGNRGDI